MTPIKTLDGVLFGSSNAHKTLRPLLVEEQKLDTVISLLGGTGRSHNSLQ